MTNKRRRRTPNDGLGVVVDGDYLSVPMQFMDDVQRAVAASHGMALHDGRGGPAGHRPGYCFDTDTDARQRADDAYEQRNKHLNNAWRKDAVTTDDKRPTNLKDAQAAAAHAYEERNQRLQNAWRDRNEHHSSKGAT
jgi:hypothetical protein